MAKGDSRPYQVLAGNVSGANPFFRDRRVRRALAHSLDRKRACRRLGFTPCHGPFHPDSPWADPEGERLAHDPAAAARLLDAAGWRRDGRGWRRRRCFYREEGGERRWLPGPEGAAGAEVVPLAFTLLLPAGSTATRDLCLRWREALARLGVQVALADTERGELVRRLFAHRFTAAFFAWTPGVDPYTTAEVFGSRGWPEGRNLGGYRCPEVDELYARAAGEMEPAARRRIYRRIDRLIRRDQPYLFLWYLPRAAALDPGLRGLGFGPQGLFGFHPGLRGWWFAAGGEE